MLYTNGGQFCLFLFCCKEAICFIPSRWGDILLSIRYGCLFLICYSVMAQCTSYSSIYFNETFCTYETFPVGCRNCASLLHICFRVIALWPFYVVDLYPSYKMETSWNVIRNIRHAGCKRDDSYVGSSFRMGRHIAFDATVCSLYATLLWLNCSGCQKFYMRDNSYIGSWSHALWKPVIRHLFIYLFIYFSLQLLVSILLTVLSFIFITIGQTALLFVQWGGVSMWGTR